MSISSSVRQQLNLWTVGSQFTAVWRECAKMMRVGHISSVIGGPPFLSPDWIVLYLENILSISMKSNPQPTSSRMLKTIVFSTLFSPRQPIQFWEVQFADFLWTRSREVLMEISRTKRKWTLIGYQCPQVKYLVQDLEDVIISQQAYQSLIFTSSRTIV